MNPRSIMVNRLALTAQAPLITGGATTPALCRSRG